jgi:hypothetical protein
VKNGTDNRSNLTYKQDDVGILQVNIVHGTHLCCHEHCFSRCGGFELYHVNIKRNFHNIFTSNGNSRSIVEETTFFYLKLCDVRIYLCINDTYKITSKYIYILQKN